MYVTIESGTKYLGLRKMITKIKKKIETVKIKYVLYVAYDLWESQILTKYSIDTELNL